MRHLLLAAASLAIAPACLAQPATPVRPATEAEVPPGQLPDTVQPAAYRLDLTVDPAQERFSGKVEIDAVLREPRSAIAIHGRGLAMRSVLATAGGRSVAGTWREADPTGTALLTFPEPLPAGPVTLAFAYDAPFNDGPAGLFRVRVGSEWYGWSQFQSIDARAAFPSFDQPSFKTPFTVTLRTPPGLVAVSNAPQASLTQEGGLDVHRFAPTLPLPTYLVAVMVGPFAVAEGEVPPTPQRAKPLPLRIVSPRPNAAKLAFALEGSKQIVALLEDYFADAFPYPKLDQITSPIMPGAMENAGADLYDDALIVMDSDAPIPQKRQFGMVVAHELAHQWFGDLVTPAWWDDIWLNESFANWMGYRIGHAWRPDLNIEAGALAEGFEAMATDALVAGRPVRQPIATNAEIDGAFDSITYGKGGHVVAMIAAFMGDTKFRDGVRRYMAAHRYGNATSTDFFAAMAEVAGDPRILLAMRSFTDQQGVPLLSFTRRGSTFTVTQGRYAPYGAAPPPARWGVPMCVRRGAARQCRLLAEPAARFTMAGAGPLVPNAGGTGYYRFELSRGDWSRLIARAGDLTGGEAQAVTDSLIASLLAGRGTVRQLGALARRLVRHPDTYAADAATAGLSGLIWAGVVDDDEARRAWQHFTDRLYAPLLAQYGFDPRAGAYAAESPERAQRRVQIVERLAASGRRDTVRGTLAAAARAWLGGDPAALDPAWYAPAFEAHLASGGDAAARSLLDTALASEDPVFRPVALGAVAGSGSKEIARWVLDDLKDERLRASEKREMLGAILQSAATREIGYDWLRGHLDELLAGNGGIFLAAQLPQMLLRFCSAERADQFARDLAPRFAGRSGALELDRTIERVRNCARLRAARGPQFTAEFRQLW
jgi:aminopeptidase N